MTLLIRLSAPMLAWPMASQYRQRRTSGSPAYNTLVGMLCAAAGVQRSNAIPNWISAAEMGVRIEKAGSVLEDYHTINPVDGGYRWLSDKDRQTVRPRALKASGGPHDHTIITRRYYRQDASYLWALADPTGQISNALQAPHWAIYGGRKACLLSQPFVLGEWAGTVEVALAEYPTPEGNDVTMQAILWHEPRRLKGVERFEEPDGNDGRLRFQPMSKTRWVCHVTPPYGGGSWLEVLEGMASVAE